MIRFLVIVIVLFLKLNGMSQSITAGTVSANDNFTPLAVDYTVRSNFSQSSTTIPGITYSVDINNDSELDFAISGGVAHIGQGGYFANLRITPLSGNITLKQVAASINSCTLMNGPNVQTVTTTMAKAFNSTDTIDNLTNWDNSAADLYRFERWGFNGCGMQNFYTPPAYIGVRLICQNDTIYGWIKVKNLNLSNTPFIELQVESYAINKSNCSGIGINELDLIKSILLFPNPTQNSVKLKLPEEFSKAIISITDLTGKTVISTKTISSNEPIDTSPLSLGIYTVKIIAGDITIHKKLVKE